MSTAFQTRFRLLTGHAPFPWQIELHARLCAGVDGIPPACVIPTGLGKTSVIPTWYLARLENGTLPRRLVYVVNRRTVVDQTTDEVEKLRRRLPEIGVGVDELAISTLRGQFADNREWSADPSRPAVICGTVDMIGSRLLFSGYGVGFKGKPLHAGFLGQDVLLVHDEAHLEEPFQKLVTSIETLQQRFTGERVAPRLRVMALTATPRGTATSLTITDADREAARDRLDATKKLILVPVEKEADVIATVLSRAHALEGANRAVLVFVKTVEGAKKIIDGLKRRKVPDDRIDLLTGTIRGFERDQLVTRPVFKRFLPNPEHEIGGTVYLICTSAGEVGVNISADDLISDLSTYDSMAQRFGRVNRFGTRNGPAGSTVTVVHPTAFDMKKPLEERRARTMALLQKLESVSPNALDALPLQAREDAFSPSPTCLALTDIRLDAWAMTSIRGRMPGRPPVEAYLHGIAEFEKPEAWVAWRKEVAVMTSEMLVDNPPRELLDAYELRPHELLRDTSDRVFAELRTLAERFGDRGVWLVDESGEVDSRQTLRTLTAKDDSLIRYRTVVLPHDIGGLSHRGMLDGSAPALDDSQVPIDHDVADLLFGTGGRQLRVRVDDRNDPRAADMRLIRSIRRSRFDDDEDGELPPWFWFERPMLKENSRHAFRPVTLDVHVGDVQRKVEEILSRLGLESSIVEAVRLAARWHDLGKRRTRWQWSIGRREHLQSTWFAKSGRDWCARPEGAYRHEFGSLLDTKFNSECAEFQTLHPKDQDLVLHLIASHHGMARPHFEPEHALDDDHPSDAAEAMFNEVPRRFARLQRRFGHWGLAYIESILRAADWHASGFPSEYFQAANWWIS